MQGTDAERKKNCLGFIRIIDDIDEHLSDEKAPLFTDVVSLNNEEM